MYIYTELKRKSGGHRQVRWWRGTKIRLQRWEQNWWGWEVLINNRLNKLCEFEWSTTATIPLIGSVLHSAMRDNACGIDFCPQILFSTFCDVWIPTCIPVYDWLTEKVMRQALVFAHRYYFWLFVMYQFLHTYLPIRLNMKNCFRHYFVQCLKHFLVLGHSW